mgnify:CR=1 FL=1
MSSFCLWSLHERETKTIAGNALHEMTETIRGSTEMIDYKASLSSMADEFYDHFNSDKLELYEN